MYKATLEPDVERYQATDRRVALEQDLSDILHENLLMEAEQQEMLQTVVDKRRVRIRQLEAKLREVTRIV
ncbi:MAG: hypothetical protein JNK19_03040 [Tabrizicola sp.]|nr:hypothetical protein [Tabrizicola sp.]